MEKNWESFVSRERDTSYYPGLRSVIYESWKRCKEFKNVDPYQLVHPEVLDGKSLGKKLAEKKEIIKIAKPIMQSLFKLIADPNLLIALFCEKGRLLEIVGNKETVKNAEKSNFVQGASWSEKDIGTNAIGTSITVNKPLQVSAYEHYCKWLHDWTGSGVPIVDPYTNRNIGVLGVFNYLQQFQSHTLGMVYAAAKNIVNEIALQNTLNNYDFLKREKTHIADLVPEAIIIVNPAGLVSEINELCCELLGLQKENTINRNIDNLFSQNVQLQKVLTDNKEVFDQQIDIYKPYSPRKYTCTITSRFINDENGTKFGRLAVISKLKGLREYTKKRTDNKARFTFDDLIGQSPKFLSSIEQAKFAAKSDSNVLLLGESGTGKELFAQSIHNQSSRREYPFIAINSAAMPRDLVASILFGYTEGAFTGARKGGNIGKFELAEGGTIFLDEIGDMPLELQPLLLRVLEEKRITRLGGKESVPVNVRIISATNKKLDQEVEKGSFRSDLFYRLNVLKIDIPPLRERQEDITLLSKMYLKQVSEQLNKQIDGISTGVFKIFHKYNWPGNVRQLQNVIEQMVNIAETTILTENSVPRDIITASSAYVSENMFKKDEKQIILTLMKQHNHNITNVAKQLCIARSTLYRKLKKFNISY